MKLHSILVQTALASAFIIAGSMQASAAKCVLAGGQGTGVTPEIATTMSKIALGTSISNMSAKAKGKVATKCESLPLISTCTSRQRACK
jgi:signal recognition particle receptor subunit beta